MYLLNTLHYTFEMYLLTSSCNSDDVGFPSMKPIVEVLEADQ